MRNPVYRYSDVSLWPFNFFVAVSILAYGNSLILILVINIFNIGVSYYNPLKSYLTDICLFTTKTII